MTLINTQGSIQHATVEGAYAWLRRSSFYPEAKCPDRLEFSTAGLPTFHVNANGYKNPRGEGVEVSSHPLAHAIRAAAEFIDPVIMVYGRLPGNTQIGGGDAGQKAYRADWGDRPMRLAIIGVGDSAVIEDISFHNKTSGSVNGGVLDCLIRNLTIEARTSNMCVGGPETDVAGTLRFYDVKFAAHESKANAHMGYGYKWGVRAKLRATWDFRNITAAPVLEHPIYLDSPAGLIVDGLVSEGSTRTGVFVVNRSFDSYASGLDLEQELVEYMDGVRTPYAPGYGQCFIQNVQIDELVGDGGSAVTIAGFLGDVYIRKLTMQISKRCHGAVVAWTDASQKKGTFLYTDSTGELRSMRGLVLENLSVMCPLMDRPAVAVAGTERTIIRNCQVQGGVQGDYSFNNEYGVGDVTDHVAVVDGRSCRITQPTKILNGEVVFTDYTPQIKAVLPIDRITR